MGMILLVIEVEGWFLGGMDGEIGMDGKVEIVGFFVEFFVMFVLGFMVFELRVSK
jgi:hypothetical protein